jgi:hypothetical protein
MDIETNEETTEIEHSHEGICLVLKFTPEEANRLFKASGENTSVIQWAKQVVMQAVQEKEMANDPHTRVFQLTSQPLSTAHIPSYIYFRVE